MAPRILMPYHTFRMKVDELLQAYDYENSPIKPAILTSVAEELREFYGVSRQSVLIRMMETGYKDAAIIYQYDEESPYHGYLDQHDSLRPDSPLTGQSVIPAPLIWNFSVQTLMTMSYQMRPLILQKPELLLLLALLEISSPT